MIDAANLGEKTCKSLTSISYRVVNVTLGEENLRDTGEYLMDFVRVTERTGNHVAKVSPSKTNHLHSMNPLVQEWTHAN